MKNGIEVFPGVVYFSDSAAEPVKQGVLSEDMQRKLREHTMAYQILRAHNKSEVMGKLKLKMDALVSPDNVYVSILQTARASGLKEFPLPFVMTNCHNSLCSIGGTINEDDHRFGYSCAKRYGGIYVPAYQAVLHQFMRENMAQSGGMIMGSDSHTRYGALGVLGIGEGGGELVKQLLGQPYEVGDPQVIAVKVTGKLPHGTGPHDVALSLIRALFPHGYAKNKILEFIGDGISSLSMDMRMGIDAMTTECAALSSIWVSDEKTESWYALHGRPDQFAPMKPQYPVCYDGLVELRLDQIQPMIALPFHPSNAYTIREFQENMEEILAETEAEGKKTMPGFSLREQVKDRGFFIPQASVAGCVGGLYENICAVRNILHGQTGVETGQSLHVFPASQAIYRQLLDKGIAGELSDLGVVMLQASCGPCFGVQDIPANNQLAMRHITRNFLNREGARATESQAACVALMDARSIAATVRSGGILTGADEIDYEDLSWSYDFDGSIYEKRVYWGFTKADSKENVVLGPNIVDWPQMHPLPEHLLLQVSGVYQGAVTTDELVPSGEASAYRSNPERLAAFTLQNRDAGYYTRAKEIRSFAEAYGAGKKEADDERYLCCETVRRRLGCSLEDLEFGSVLLAEKIGDGSAREQAASSQRILGGRADIAVEYATKRFRSNLINWGILPLVTEKLPALKAGDFLLFSGIRAAIMDGAEHICAEILTSDGGRAGTLELSCPQLAEEEKQLLLAGSLINYRKQCN